MAGRGVAVAVLLLGVLAAIIALPGSSSAQQDPNTCVGPVGGGPKKQPGGAPLTFGIYPGGVAGQVGPAAPAKPESQDKIFEALGKLRGGPERPFVVHLYRSWRNPESDAAEERKVVQQIDTYRSRGYLVEYVVRYRPEGGREGDVAAYTEFVRAFLRRHGSKLKAIQVTNEVNQPTSPDSSDGSYPRSRDALIQGVIAAKDEARKLGLKTEVGFNWFYRYTPPQETDFWSYLGANGGPRFVQSLDYVGVDAYPGTFFPPVGTGEGNAMINAFGVLRDCYLPLAKIPASVPLHVQENGWPTGPNRSYEKQRDVLADMVKTVHEYRRTYNVTDYRWFDLRDADSDDPQFTQQYGMMRHDYTPKPAFGEYASRIARYASALPCADRSAPSSRIGRGRIRSSRKRLRVRGGAWDKGCRRSDGRFVPAGVRRVEYAVRRKSGRRCRFVGSRGRLGKRRSCRRPVWLRARGGARWRVSKRVRLPRGNYRIVFRAIDREGNRERARTRRFKVR